MHVSNKCRLELTQTKDPHSIAARGLSNASSNHPCPSSALRPSNLALARQTGRGIGHEPTGGWSLNLWLVTCWGSTPALFRWRSQLKKRLAGRGWWTDRHVLQRILEWYSMWMLDMLRKCVWNIMIAIPSYNMRRKVLYCGKCYDNEFAQISPHVCVCVSTMCVGNGYHDLAVG